MKNWKIEEKYENPTNLLYLYCFLFDSLVMNDDWMMVKLMTMVLVLDSLVSYHRQMIHFFAHLIAQWVALRSSLLYCIPFGPILNLYTACFLIRHLETTPRPLIFVVVQLRKRKSIYVSRAQKKSGGVKKENSLNIDLVNVCFL